MLSWIQENGVDLIQTIAIFIALIITIKEFRKAQRISKFSLEHEIVKSHRELFLQIISDPELGRTLKDQVNLDSDPLTTKEKMYVTLLILHIYSVFQANKSGFHAISLADKADIAGFFRLPVPHAVWNLNRIYYKPDFIEFIEKILTDHL